MNCIKITLKALVLSLLTIAIIPAVTHASDVVDVDAIRQARNVSASDRAYAYRLWFADLVEQAVIDDDIAFLDDVMNSQHTSGTPLSVRKAEHPFTVTAAELAGLSGTSYFTNTKLIARIFDGPATNFVTRILQKFPKTTKASPWALAVAIQSYELYETIEHHSLYEKYKNASPTDQLKMYHEKLDRLHALQIDKANLWLQVEQADTALSYFDEQLAKKEVKFVR